MVLKLSKMSYQFTTVSGRKYNLSAAEYSLLSEYRSVKSNHKKVLTALVMLCITLLLVFNPSNIGIAEQTKKTIEDERVLPQKNLFPQAENPKKIVPLQDITKPQKMNIENRLWVQIELPSTQRN